MASLVSAEIDRLYEACSLAQRGLGTRLNTSCVTNTRSRQPANNSTVQKKTSRPRRSARTVTPSVEHSECHRYNDTSQRVNDSEIRGGHVRVRPMKPLQDDDDITIYDDKSAGARVDNKANGSGLIDFTHELPDGLNSTSSNKDSSTRLDYDCVSKLSPKRSLTPVFLATRRMSRRVRNNKSRGCGQESTNGNECDDAEDDRVESKENKIVKLGVNTAKLDDSPKRAQPPENVKTKEYRLRKWVIRPVQRQRCIIVEGFCIQSNKEVIWRSTGIVKALTKRTLQTGSGSVYKLIGRMSVGLAKNYGFSKSFCASFVDGFPADWDVLVENHFSDSVEQVEESNGSKKTNISNKRSTRVGNQSYSDSLPTQLSVQSGELSSCGTMRGGRDKVPRRSSRSLRRRHQPDSTLPLSPSTPEKDALESSTPCGIKSDDKNIPRKREDVRRNKFDSSCDGTSERQSRTRRKRIETSVIKPPSESVSDDSDIDDAILSAKNRVQKKKKESGSTVKTVKRNSSGLNQSLKRVRGRKKTTFVSFNVETGVTKTSCWCDEEMERFSQAVKQVSADVEDYWSIVANIVYTKSSDECRAFHLRDAPNSDKKSKVQKAVPPPKLVLDENSVNLQLSGGKGTFKRKKQLQSILGSVSENHNNDYFESSEWKNNKRRKIIVPDSINTPGTISKSNSGGPIVGCMINTPNTQAALQPTTDFDEGKTPVSKFLSPDTLNNVYNEQDDLYIHRCSRLFRGKVNATNTSSPVLSAKNTIGTSSDQLNADTVVKVSITPKVFDVSYNDDDFDGDGEEIDNYFSGAEMFDVSY